MRLAAIVAAILLGLCVSAQAQPVSTVACSEFADAKALVDIEVEQNEQEAVKVFVSNAAEKKCKSIYVNIGPMMTILYHRTTPTGRQLYVVVAMRGKDFQYAILQRDPPGIEA